MRLTVLVDNNTIIDRYFLGEPGISYLIQDDSKNILLDTGYSDIFIRNAQKLGVDICNIDYLAISHGHSDHTWGISHLIRHYSEAMIEKKQLKKPLLVAHPQAFEHKFCGDEVLGSTISDKMLSNFFRLNLTKEPLWITDKLVFLGEIERAYNFENKNPIGKHYKDDVIEDDYLLDDTALAYKSKDGLIIITGCSHSGICNIVEHAKRVCNDSRVIDIIGGFHLLNPQKEQLEGTVSYMKQLNLRELHACHCTDLSSKIALAKAAPMKEVGVGMIFEYE